MHDYYKVLGVEKNASQDDIRRAYHKLALKYHPDKNPNDTRAATQFKLATEAYEVLKDEASRQRYDMGGTDSFSFHSPHDIFEQFSREFGGMFGGNMFSDPFQGFGGQMSNFGQMFGNFGTSQSIQTTIINGVRTTKRTTIVNGVRREETIVDTPGGRRSNNFLPTSKW